MGWLAWLTWDFEDFMEHEITVADVIRDVNIVMEFGPEPISPMAH